jgi:hypothetical protein
MGDGRSSPRPGHLVQECVCVWAPGRSGQVRKILPLPEFDPRTVQPVASRYTYHAITAHMSNRVQPKSFDGFMSCTGKDFLLS